jgi:Domain of unknown function (DUF4845)
MGSLKMFLGVFVIVAGVYGSVKVLPPYFENYQFQDAVKDAATRATYAPTSENEIRAGIFKKAQEYDIPVKEEGIQVQRQGSQFNGMVIIHVPYVVHIDFPGYPLDLNFDASTENKSVF